MALLRAVLGWKLAPVVAFALAVTLFLLGRSVPTPLLGLFTVAVCVTVAVLAVGVRWAT
ncbi:hypothetical protein [Halomarina rubra]|uniref:Uncharacterized protein n=1 Tax=Halomarina rubra TaxID=2071873 RepID=A0ABD6AS86_9EURY|nr:hypothetical protein [Halomarina rubra]